MKFEFRMDITCFTYCPWMDKYQAVSFLTPSFSLLLTRSLTIHFFSYDLWKWHSSKETEVRRAVNEKHTIVWQSKTESPFAFWTSRQTYIDLLLILKWNELPAIRLQLHETDEILDKEGNVKCVITKQK